MKNKLFNLGCFFFILASFSKSVSAQSAGGPKYFLESPDANSRMEDSLKRQFEKQNLTWPPQSMYLRSFKFDKQLEIWVKSNSKAGYKLFKTYKVCQQSGSMGPKRVEGDYQVPEGFYYINEFNPNSNYHLSLGINYPNASDRILSDANRPGSAIYIHGDCVSTGCIPITDAPIEELYFLASNVRNQGQEFIPVHVFPVKYSVKKSMDFLETSMKDNDYLQQFNSNIKEVFDFFEAKKELPVIMVNRKGEYVVN
ncbi:MAG: murein L,D-transpeptidase family protein [Ferruginibacter sp.]